MPALRRSRYQFLMSRWASCVRVTTWHLRATGLHNVSDDPNTRYQFLVSRWASRVHVITWSRIAQPPDFVSVTLTHDTSYLCRAEPLFALMFVMFGYCSLLWSVKRTFSFDAIEWQLLTCVSITCLSAFVVCLVFLLFISIVLFNNNCI